MTWSGQEALHQRDFEKMTVEEIEAARRAIGRMRLPIMEVPTRRFRTDRAGPRADMRATIRAALRTAGDILPLKRRRTSTRHPPLVVLSDNSGSIERYSRMLLKPEERRIGKDCCNTCISVGLANHYKK